MTTYTFPPAGKTLYGLTTGTVYKPVEGKEFPWRANGLSFSPYSIALTEPDGVTDVRPFKVGDTISTVEELEALPDGAILRHEGGVWEKYGGSLFSTRGEGLSVSAELADGDVFTILWLPETGDRA